MEVVEQAVEAIRAGRPVVLPMDTVYGLATNPYREEATWRVYRLKGRPDTTPSALVAADFSSLFDCVPELFGRSGVIARALLPGPYTLVLPNPARRYLWLTGLDPETIGVRIPELEGPSRDILDRVGAVMATSANLHGGREPRALADVPQEIREGAALAIDGGELPGIPSTVLDFTGPEPRVLREGLVSGAEAIERALSAVA